MNLLDALRLDRNARIALVGAGGKTTALFQIAREFEPPALVTASTHLGEWQVGFADRHWMVTRVEDVERFSGQIEGVTLFTGPPTGEERMAGLDAESLKAVKILADRLGFPVLVEGDGSRQKPLKAPGEHEPAIPPWVEQVVVVAGLSGLGSPLEEKTVHRAGQFSSIAGLRMGDTIGEEHLARVLSSPEGGLKNIPVGARVFALLNQADRPDLVEAGLRISQKLHGVYFSVLVASLSENKIWAAVEQAAGVVLAAGGSRRFGQAKMLVNWRGKPLVRHAAEAALAGGLSPVIVVAGAEGEAMREALAGLPVKIVENPEWAKGQSTSLQAGLRELPPESGPVVFLLGDQPAVSGELIEALQARHSQTLASVVAPRVHGQRANPVLFDRRSFADLLILEGDTGGRAVLDRYKIEYVDWEDEQLLLDVDTPGDYERLLGFE